MRLRELLGEVGALVDGDVEVTGIAIDSRRVRAGDVFFALAGHTGDGARHVAEAVARGASAVVAAADVAAPGTPVVRIDQPRRVLGEAAARLAGDPSARFDAAVFTNLTRDHLDFHGDLARYYAAKARLFLEYLPRGGKPDPVAIVNLDDPAGERLLGCLATRAIAVGRSPRADVRPLEIETSLTGTRGVLDVAGARLRFTSRLVGAPHVENILVAAGTAWALGVDREVIGAGLAAVEPPPGRLEQIAGPSFTAVVDYAHSPDALARALDVLRPLATGRLIVVFGCGGDRDRGKRPLMGEAAARRADLVVLTSDNPRTEDPLDILAEVEAGIRSAGLPGLTAPASGARGYVVEPDRPAAIALAIGLARRGDIVLVAGKGHEDYQIVGTEKRRLDDREEVRRAIGGIP